MNTGRVIDEPVRVTPDRVALVVGDREVTYGELEDLVNGCVARLDEHGVEPGDRVAVVARGGVTAVVAILACARAGAASAQLNVSLKVPELRQLVADIGARVGIADEAYADRLREALDGPVLTEPDIAAVDGSHVADRAVGGG